MLRLPAGEFCPIFLLHLDFHAVSELPDKAHTLRVWQGELARGYHLCRNLRDERTPVSPGANGEGVVCCGAVNVSENGERGFGYPGSCALQSRVKRFTLHTNGGKS